MSLLDTPLWVVIQASFSPNIWKELLTPIVDTLYITGVASLTRLLFGRSYGRDPCIISIAASCIPMYARIVESSLKEIAKGKIDAAKSVGSTNWQIVFQIIIPETLPSIVRGFTVAVISIISMTALAGLFGAGGIGDVAVRFGYQRFQHDRLFACVYVLVILVQLIQAIGNGISNHILRKRCLV